MNNKIKIKYVILCSTVCYFITLMLLNAATSGVYNIKVKIVEEQVGIEIVTSDLDFGYVVKGTSVTSGGVSTAVKNTGAVNIDLKLKISGSPTGWTPGTTLNDVGTDKYVLATVFHEWDGLIKSTNPYSCFGNEDVLTTTDKFASPAIGQGGNGTFASEFINGQAVETPVSADGYNLAPGEQVNNFFFFNAPTSLSNSGQYGQEQTITVTVTAVIHQ